MSDLPDTLAMAVADAVRRREGLEDAIRTAEASLGSLRRQLREVQNEQSVLENVASRRKPIVPELDLGLTHPADPDVVDDHLETVLDWGNLARSSAVLDAVVEITSKSGSATPGDILELLSHRNRDNDTRALVSAALAYLHTKHLVQNVGRGQWTPATGSDEGAV